MQQKPSDDLLTLVMSCARPGPKRFPALIASVCLHTCTKPNDVRSAIELLVQRGELQLDVEMRLCVTGDATGPSAVRPPATHQPAAAFNAAMISGFLQDLRVRLDTARAAGKDKVALCALELEILLRMADD